jgi:zinc/manganese transport system substrate-binding protein
MTFRIRRVTAALAGVAALALTLSACSGSPASAPSGTSGAAAPRIATISSTDVWGSVVRAVGGDQVEVTALIDDPSKDPHGYETSAADAVKIKDAKLAVYNGNGYDDFFGKALDTVGGDRKTVVAFDLSGRPADGNEHVFYDLPTVKKVADRVAADLGAIRPEQKDTFARNAKDFGIKIDDLLARAAKIGATKPGAKVVATEPVAEFLVQAAGLTDVTPEDYVKAVEGDSEVPAAAIAQFSDLITGKQVSALLNNAQTETDVTTQFIDKAKAANVPVVAVTETLPKGVTDYVGWIGAEVDALRTALGVA